jgi:chaperonin GroEL
MPSVNPKLITSADTALAAILTGVNLLADTVGATLGPGGRNILLDQGPFHPPRSSRDGVTVAKHIALADPLADLAARLVRQAADKAATAAGDGTTTATILTQAIYREGNRLIAAGANPVLLRRGIEQAAAAVVGERDDAGRFSGGLLAALVTPIVDAAGRVTAPDRIRQIGTLSANSDPALGQLVAQALEAVGKDGTVTVEESQSLETTLEVVEGMQFNQGYLSPYFITDPDRGECVLAGEEDRPVQILLHERRLASYRDLLPLLDRIGGPDRANLLVVAEDVTDTALAFLAMNRVRQGLRVCAVKGPGFADRRRGLFEDLAVLTGATLISPELGIKPGDFTPDLLGSARRVTVTKDDCTVVGGGGRADLLAGRLADLRAQIDRADGDFDRERLRERLAKLTGGVAVVKVGGQTEAEMRERKDRAEDAMYATRAAVLEGIVPGGGAALLRAAGGEEYRQALAAAEATHPTVRDGWWIVKKACEEPLRRIVENAGGAGGDVVAEFKRWLHDSERCDPGWGYNAATNQFEDLLASGVIDPVRVTRTALLSAASIAGLLLTTGAIVADDVEAMGRVRRAIAPVMPGGPGGGSGQGMPLQY